MPQDVTTQDLTTQDTQEPRLGAALAGLAEAQAHLGVLGRERDADADGDVRTLRACEAVIAARLTLTDALRAEGWLPGPRLRGHLARDRELLRLDAPATLRDVALG